MFGLPQAAQAQGWGHHHHHHHHHGGYGGYGGYGRTYGTRDGSRTQQTQQSYAPNGWEGAGRTAAPGMTPHVGGNWAPPPSHGPRQLK